MSLFNVMLDKCGNLLSHAEGVVPKLLKKEGSADPARNIALVIERKGR